MKDNFQVGPAAQDDCVEAELVHDGAGPRPERPYEAPPPPQQPRGLLARLRGLLGGAALLVGAGLLLIGALLTSTVIGAIIGVPLMLAGGGFLWLSFKLLGSGLPGRFVFRKFP